MKRCKNCSFISNDNTITCPKCGSSLDADYTYICNKCGKVFQDNETVCSKCGTKRVYLSNGRLSNIKAIGVAIKNKFVEIMQPRNKLQYGVILFICFICSFLVSYYCFLHYSTESGDINIPSVSDLNDVEISYIKSFETATIVGVDETNIYELPTTYSRKVGTIHRGDNVEILQRERCSDPTAAVLRNRYDIPEGTHGYEEIHLKKGAPLRIEGSQYGFYYCSINENRDYGFLLLAPNEIVTLYGKIWYNVIFDDRTGWICSEFARIDD